MRLTNFLVRDAIIPNLAATATGIDPRDQTAVRAVKQQVIGEMVASLRKAGYFRDDDLQDIVKAVMRREELGTTGHRPRHRDPALAPPVGRSAHRHARSLARRLAVREPGRRSRVRVLPPGLSPGPTRGPPAGPGGRRADDARRGVRSSGFARVRQRDEIWALLENAAPGW